MHDRNIFSIVSVEYEQLQTFMNVFLHYASIGGEEGGEDNISFINEELRLT